MVHAAGRTLTAHLSRGTRVRTLQYQHFAQSLGRLAPPPARTIS
jgi:hypothetical protein